jgi:hypothetical protein
LLNAEVEKREAKAQNFKLMAKMKAKSLGKIDLFIVVVVIIYPNSSHIMKEGGEREGIKMEELSVFFSCSIFRKNVMKNFLAL